MAKFGIDSNMVFDADGKSVATRLSDHDTQMNDIMQQVYNIKFAPYKAKGDGITDDTTVIQNAINDATNAGGGIVVIPPSISSYIFTSLTVKANVTLKSLGGILKLKNNTFVSSSTSYYAIHNINGSSFYSNVTLDGLIVDANAVNNTSFLVGDTITIGGSNAVVKNCNLYNTCDSGIMFSDVTNGTCIYNRIDGTGSPNMDTGIYVNDGNGSSAFENIIMGNRITGFPGSGIALKRISQRTIVSENTIYNCGGGITLEQSSVGTDYSKNISIMNNRLRYIGYNSTNTQTPTISKVGINIRESDFTIVSGNRIEDVVQRGVYVEACSHCNITNNIITFTSNADAQYGNGIELIDRDSLGCNYNTINGNVIKDANYRGIYLSSSVNSQFNTITANVVRNNTSQKIALRVNGTFTNNNISNNVLDGGGSPSYDIEYYSGAINNKVDNNVYVNGLIAGNLDQSNRVAFVSYGTNIVSVGNAAPTTGTWKTGDYVVNSQPSELGSVGSKYIIRGFSCTVAGTPGTWLQDRGLTGN
jgi:parallel beta-helix repeat protein